MSQGFAGLGGTWTHSFEEDEADILVYRPTHSFAFPPSRRGRRTLEFDGTGQVTMGAPGPDDRHRSTYASLTPLGMNRFRVTDSTGAPSQIIHVIELGPDVLKVRFE